MGRILYWRAAALLFGTFLVVLPLVVYVASDNNFQLFGISSSLRTVQKGHGGVRCSSGDAGNASRPQPSVTWLMSFPNSGTSYTMGNTEAVSQRSTATNYATEISIAHGDPVPLLRDNEDDINKGPWQRNTDLPLPEKRVLCKTHCTGYLDTGSVEESVETFDSFMDGCRESYQRRDKSILSASRNKLRLYYEIQGLVDSAIHLIRDPFDNIISRMHLGMRNHHNLAYANLTREELDAFMETKEGVTAWCKYVDEQFWKENKVTMDMHISNKTLSLLPYDPTPYLDVPCHGEFFRYTQWHNLAMDVIRASNLSVHHVHYENYGIAYNRTVDQILNFLGQSREFETRPFVTGKTYRDVFFENSVQHRVKHLIKEIASDETWALLRGYFTSAHPDDENVN